VRNYFAAPWVGARYARGRPDVHTAVAGRIRERVAPRGPLARALDVGCGTGLSTRALALLAESVVGVDPAAPMLAHTKHHARVRYVRGVAEALPLAAGAFDLVAVACALHWCDHDAFAAEARRVLRPGGWLVVYDNQFRGQTPRSSELTDWLKTDYYRGMPWAPRSPGYDPEAQPLRGFACAHHEAVEEWVPMTRAELVAFLLTQSSPVAAVEAGQASVTELEARLQAGLAGHFAGSGSRTAFRFAGRVFFLRPT
jgi:SAM-dependent methyltransferase